ncbi:MAG TPA: pyruvate, phosphate dikinase [Clostridiales bacterium]|nr:pyruvate, phosphate dikinase [Clostridiales bacterium]
MTKKFVYLFKEADSKDRAKFGGKGANLAEMTKLGLPVPQGFIITTEACTQYYVDGEKINDDIIKEIFEALEKLEKQQGKSFGSIENPFLVSVRSGARASMPGMMDTILNLGLNDETVEGLAKLTDNPRFAYDSYRRFIQMYSDVVCDVNRDGFEKIIDQMKVARNVKRDDQLNAEDMQKMVQKFKAYFKTEKGYDFPQDPREQLIGSVEAVFRSWNNARAIAYRRMNNIPAEWGTAVNVQTMVFGNMGETSGTGVAFTRNPSTGENKLYGEYLMNAQGEDVVAGIRTPFPISHLKETDEAIYNQFVDISERLENHFRDMQDLEFTIERGKLYMLQTRNGKRTATAAINIAIDLVNEGLLTEEEALLKVEPKQLDDLLHPTFVPSALANAKPIASGLPASPGGAFGKISFSADDVKKRVQSGEKVILVRLETSPEDIEGMHAAQGILTGRGGLTSHAAVVARGMGKCCVSGVSSLVIDEEKETLTVDGKVYGVDDVLSIDGSTGFVYAGAIETQEPEITGNFATIMEWANKYRTLKVRANADNPKDASVAYEYGAEGIGLCRTEHMFFDPSRINDMRQMILSKTAEERKEALAKLLPMQREDFKGIYRALHGNPVTIRFLDPPLHEFLSVPENEFKAIADKLKITVDELKNAVSELKELNPMLGHRGCRLAITYPEIYAMQTRAVLEAAIAVSEEGENIEAEIMIPLVSDVKELQYVKKIVVETAEKVFEEKGKRVKYQVGTMIELPRAAITADAIAREAEFFSFGTNDLTQTTFGFSRDDANKFLPTYYDKQIFGRDPFEGLDLAGVGELVKIAVEKGKSTRKDIKLGICGEHGGDPATIDFCYNAGLDYVSCSPYRVPIAILAAAHASINAKNAKKK